SPADRRMDAVRADEDVRRCCRSIVEVRGHAVRTLFICREGFAETGVVLQSREQGLAQHASIHLPGDVTAAFPVFEIETEACEFSRLVIEKHKGTGLAGSSRRPPNALVIPPGQARA